MPLEGQLLVRAEDVLLDHAGIDAAACELHIGRAFFLGSRERDPMQVFEHSLLSEDAAFDQRLRKEPTHAFPARTLVEHHVVRQLVEHEHRILRTLALLRILRQRNQGEDVDGHAARRKVPGRRPANLGRGGVHQAREKRRVPRIAVDVDDRAVRQRVFVPRLQQTLIVSPCRADIEIEIPRNEAAMPHGAEQRSPIEEHLDVVGAGPVIELAVHRKKMREFVVLRMKRHAPSLRRAGHTGSRKNRRTPAMRLSNIRFPGHYFTKKRMTPVGELLWDQRLVMCTSSPNASMILSLPRYIATWPGQ